MGKHSVSISENEFNSLIEKLTETYGEARGHIQPFIDEAVIEKLEKENPSDSLIRAYSNDIKIQKIRTLQDMVQRNMAFINFYGAYADSNKSNMLKAMGDIDDEYKELIENVFDSGKGGAEESKPLLKNLLIAINDLRSKGAKKRHRSKEEWAAIKEAIKEVKEMRVK